MSRLAVQVLALSVITPSTSALNYPRIVVGRRFALSALAAIPLAADAMLPGSALLPGSGVSGGPWFTTSITPERKAEIRARRNGQTYVPNNRVAWRECEPGDDECVAKRKQGASPSAQLAEALTPVSPEERAAAIKAQAASCRVFCDKELPGSVR